MPDPRNFEEAMSLLSLAVGYVQRNLPSNQCEASRLGEQVGRIDRIWAKSAAAVKFSAANVEEAA